MIAQPGFHSTFEPQATMSRILQWMAGCLLFSLGVKFFIDSNLGTDPLHALILGIVGTVRLPFVQVGVVELCLVLVSLAVWIAWTRSFPVVTVVSVFLTMVSVGFLIDLWNALHLEDLTSLIGNRWLVALVGFLLDSYASALIIISGFGIRSMDLLAITCVQTFKVPFVVPKIAFEAGFVIVGWALGGPVGLVTILFVVLVSVLIQFFMNINSRWLGMINHGLATPGQRTLAKTA